MLEQVCKRYRQRGLLFSIMLCVSIIFTGCSSNTYVSNYTPDVLEDYRNRVALLEPLENDIVTNFNSVIGSKFIDSDTTLKVLIENVIPKSEEYLKKVEDIRPNSNYLDTIHALYVVACRLQHGAFLDLKIALEMGNTDLITEAIVKLDKSKQHMASWKEKINLLSRGEKDARKRPVEWQAI